MSEKNLSLLQSLHGLQDYFEFTNDLENKKFVDFLLKLFYADKPIIQETTDSCLEEFVYTLKKFVDAKVIDMFYKYYREGYDPASLADAFSRGQVQSKIWLATELSKIRNSFDVSYFLAGWFGQLRLYFDAANISYNKIRVMDIDSNACQISDTIFNLEKIENFKVKSVQLDLNDMSWLYRTGCEYIIKTAKKEIKEKTSPDLIVNTSAEHFEESWYHKFVNRPLDTDPLFVIQSNNLFNVSEHINAVHSIKELKKKFPMSRVEYEGELQLRGYKRFMLIGRP